MNSRLVNELLVTDPEWAKWQSWTKTLSIPADSSLPVTDVRTGLPVHVDHDHAH